MKRSLKKISQYKVETNDGTSGQVKDFLFDEKAWIIRYLEVEFGSLFSAERVLIPRAFFGSPHWHKQVFPLEISKKEIEKCPKIEDRMPVSRKYEEELHKYYDAKPYWSTAYADPLSAMYPPPVASFPNKNIKEEELDTLLRSFGEVEGYHVQATDDKFGHIDDLIIDDENWHISHAIIDTRNWMPWSKKVMLAIRWLEEVSFTNKIIEVKLDEESIKNAPEYSPVDPIEKDYENHFDDYFSSSLVK